MKYVITHLKAPWPEGSKVGDTVTFKDLPAWAQGKCKPANVAEDVPDPVELNPGAAKSQSASLAAAEEQAKQEAAALHAKGKAGAKA